MRKPESQHSVIVLLGQQDEPPDGLGDYCMWLGEPTRRRHVAFEALAILRLHGEFGFGTICLCQPNAALPKIIKEGARLESLAPK